MENKLVSILIASYQKGEWLADCLWSAFSQTYKPTEIIICDNGSTDQSLDIINSFSGAPNLVVSIYKDRLGIARAANKNIEKASGEYICFLDGDDLMRPEHVDNMMRSVGKNPDADMIYGKIFYETADKVLHSEYEPDIDLIFDKCSIPLVGCIIKKSLFEELGGLDEKIGYSVDWEFIIRVIKAGKKIVKGYDTGYLHRDIDPRSYGHAFFLSSLDRINDHRYIREKHGLKGLCQCGCSHDVLLTGATGDVINPGQTISVSMIVKDEELILKRCLESVKNADEIVILDTGSTDKTGEVVQDFRRSTLVDLKYIEGEYKWNDDFSEARNESLKRCTGDWILIIDADEQLEVGGIERAKDLISRVPPMVRAISFRTLSERGGLEHSSVRLFRNKVGITWHGAVHNYLSARANLESGIALRYSYSPAHEKDPDRALRILTKVVEAEPDCLRERFYLAREYYYRKKWDVAIEHYRKYLEKAHWVPEKAEAWMQVSRCYAQASMIFEARLACLRAIDLNPDFKDAFNWMANLTNDLNEKNKWVEIAGVCKNTNTLFHSTG